MIKFWFDSWKQDENGGLSTNKTQAQLSKANNIVY